MQPTRFETCLAETLGWEGGYSNHPADPGGPTMQGVIQRVYDAWRDRMALPRRPVRQIERREVEAIYRQQYWDAVRGDELPHGVDLAVFDYGVNSGPARAIKALQRLVGATPDGHLGAATLAALARAEPVRLVTDLMAERRRFLRQIRHYPVFAKGWERRCNGVEAAALAMLGQMEDRPSVMPLLDAEAQSESQGRATIDPPRSMLDSSTGNTSSAVGMGGTIQLGLEVSQAAAKVQMQGQPLDLAAFFVALLSSPSFWIAAGTVAGAAYIWLERRAKLVREAV